MASRYAHGTVRRRKGAKEIGGKEKLNLPTLVFGTASMNTLSSGNCRLNPDHYDCVILQQ
jgi:hypothetical protein